MLLNAPADDGARVALLYPITERLSRVTENARSAIVADVVDAFSAWKARQADGNGTVEVVRFGGLLSNMAKGDLLVRSRKPIDEAEPNECAGAHVRNDIDLAFHLLTIDDATFKQVILRHGLEAVLGTIALWSWKDADIFSLARLNELFTRFVLIELNASNTIGKELFAELKSLDRSRAEKRERMKKVQAKGVEALKVRAASEHPAYKQMAAEYKAAHPRAKKPEIVRHIKSHGARQSEKTISRLIAGYQRSIDS